MQTLVIYDVPSDKIRNKIADVCLDYGLTRIQYSAFLGQTTENRREEILGKIKRQLGNQEGNVQMFVMCDKDLGKRKGIVNEPKGNVGERRK